jgi:GNAT superfamily N-acetyltransferase
MPTIDTFPSMPLKHPNLDRLAPLPPTPDGFRLRTWQEGDERTVPPVLDDAFDDPDAGIYENQLKNWHAKPGVAPEGCFVLETAQGLPVATAIGRIDPSEPRVGRLHQVAVRRTYWRRGLGSLTVSAALHYMARHHRKVAITGFEWDALLFYLSLGFCPTLEEEDLLREDEDANLWETAQVWGEIFQVLGQTHPSQRDLLERCALMPLSGFPQPSTPSDVWHDDFIVDDDGDIKAIRATIDDKGPGVHFSAQVMAPETFVAALQAHAVDPTKPIFLIVEQENYPYGLEVRTGLWSTGYTFSGLVSPRQLGSKRGKKHAH